jgi:EAL domain-containing protein (putative c-di-GMP-specific phosphodiesterase class I)/FixJ family two-component response regulator
MSRGPDNYMGQPFAGCAFVLDDEPQIGAFICKVIDTFGLTTRQFTSPAFFLAEFKASPPELVVLDLSLGQSDAVEIIRHLEVGNYRGRVLLISGRDETTLNEITQIGEKRGLSMLPPLKKPFRAADIKQRLASHVTDDMRSEVRTSQADADPENKVSIQIVEALHNNWLEVWYQPKIALDSFAVNGAEGLVRARHPVHGIVAPNNFLPPAGDPAYQPLTKFVVERAMVDWSRFAQQGVLVKLSVNAPASVIHTPAFIALVRSALPSDPNFPGLTIEVTEDELIHDGEWAHEVASQLKLYNVDLSIDDFGTGYASLSRLKDLPFAEVKIDRSFVSGCASNELKRSLCQTVVDLAHRFGATVCAEGVETVEDLRAVMAMQCDTAQGFLFGKAVPAANFTPTLLAAITGATRSLLQSPSAKDHWLAQSA